MIGGCVSVFCCIIEWATRLVAYEWWQSKVWYECAYEYVCMHVISQCVTHLGWAATNAVLAATYESSGILVVPYARCASSIILLLVEHSYSRCFKNGDEAYAFYGYDCDRKITMFVYCVWSIVNLLVLIWRWPTLGTLRRSRENFKLTVYLFRKSNNAFYMGWFGLKIWHMDTTFDQWFVVQFLKRWKDLFLNSFRVYLKRYVDRYLNIITKILKAKYVCLFMSDIS